MIAPASASGRLLLLQPRLDLVNFSAPSAVAA